jgi:hypothetical protein
MEEMMKSRIQNPEARIKTRALLKRLFFSSGF